jgi:N-acetylmuramoyl-L-alanine amidase
LLALLLCPIACAQSNPANPASSPATSAPAAPAAPTAPAAPPALAGASQAPPTTATPATTAPAPAPPAPAPLPPLIVIDPGHSGSSLTTIDAETQIRDEEYRNTPETQNMWDVALLLKDKLETAGYRVLLTKDGPFDTVPKRERVDHANKNNAALGVSLHTSGHTFGEYGEIYIQRMDSYRQNIHGQRVYFNLAGTAALSREFGEIFLRERRKIEGSRMRIAVNTSWGGRGLAPGNLPIVQLWSKVPWLLLEAGVPRTQAHKEGYAQSVFDSIVACVPLDYATPPIDDTPFRIRYDETDENLRYSGTWASHTATGSSGPGYKRTSSGSSSVTVTFAGSSFAWIATCGTSFGRAFVSLDGAPPEAVDLYRPATRRQQNVWSVAFEQAGNHTVKIWRDPGNSSGLYISIDAVEVTGPVGSLMPPS